MRPEPCWVGARGNEVRCGRVETESNHDRAAAPPSSSPAGGNRSELCPGISFALTAASCRFSPSTASISARLRPRRIAPGPWRVSSSCLQELKEHHILCGVPSEGREETRDVSLRLFPPHGLRVQLVSLFSSADALGARGICMRDKARGGEGRLLPVQRLLKAPFRYRKVGIFMDVETSVVFCGSADLPFSSPF